MTNKTKTPAMVLQELTVKLGIAPPEYNIVYSISGTHENRFDYQVSVANIIAKGTGPSKQISKHTTALNALAELEIRGLYNPSSNPVNEFNTTAPDSPFKNAINCIGPLKDLCAENKIPDPIFKEISDVGPPHCRQFTWQCQVSSITTQATGNTKKLAKQLAAKEMLERIKYIIPELADKDKSLVPANAFDEKDSAAAKKYCEIIPNNNNVVDKSLKIECYTHVLKKKMMEKNLQFQDFIQEFYEKTEEAFSNILTRLEFDYKFVPIQSEPEHIVALNFICDAPLVTLGIGQDINSAKETAVIKAFELLSVFMSLDLTELR